MTRVLMGENLKIVSFLACGSILSLGLLCLCNVARAEGILPGVDGKADNSQKKDGQAEKGGLYIQQQDVHIIQGDVLRVEGDTYFIKELGGRERSLRTDPTTTKTEKIQVGDPIEAQVDEVDRGLSLLLGP